jgi:hypothetical protein
MKLYITSDWHFEVSECRTFPHELGRVPDGGVAPEGHHDAGLAGLVRRPRLAG